MNVRNVLLAAATLIVGCFTETGGPAPACTRAADCSAGEVCTSGVCTETPVECGPSMPCAAGSECRSGSCEISCPDGTRRQGDECVPVCTTNAECGDEACVDGECRACFSDAECGAEVCVAGHCETRCVTNEDCEGEAICHRGACGLTCIQDAALCSRFVATETTRVVAGDRPSSRFARLGCQVSVESFVDVLCDGVLPFPGPSRSDCDACLEDVGGCGAGQTCVAGDCTCDTNEDCPGALVCAEGFCAPCAADDECGCDEYCSGGVCRPACTNDDECALSLVCANGRCAGCRSDADCPGVARCYEDGCVQPCTAGADGCRESGRSTVCEVYEPIDEFTAPTCD
ncbi:MAG: hypothetical protein AB8H86_29875 [Polyangiales bacterium]